MNGVTTLPVVTVDAEFGEQVRQYAASSGRTYADVVRGALRATVTREAPTYAMDGRGPSFVRDLFAGVVDNDPDAQTRLARFSAERADLARRIGSASFALTTGNASAVIPPGYRPDLYVPQAIFDRPFRDASTPVAITNATPFNLPAFASSSNTSGMQVEGVNPSEGTLGLGTVTVSPTGISGTFRVTREVYDSSNPALDQLAADVMTESYQRQTEALAYAECNGPNGQAGTITAGFVPSGAQVSNVVTATEATASAELADVLTRYPFRRGIKARNVLLSQAGAELVNGTFEPATGDAQALARVQGALVNPAPAATLNGAGDADAFILAGDLMMFESSVMSFAYTERAAVAYVDLALWAYFAVRLARPGGLAAIRFN